MTTINEFLSSANSRETSAMTAAHRVRPATREEIAVAGFAVEGDQARSPSTGAWYALDDFRVHNSRTNDAGEREYGEFLSLDAELPASERYCEPL